MKRKIFLIIVIVVMTALFAGCNANNESKTKYYNDNFNPSLNNCSRCGDKATKFIGQYFCDDCYDYVMKNAPRDDMSEILGRY